MIGALFVYIHLVIIAKGKAKAIRKDVILIAAYIGGKIDLRTPRGATIGRGAKINIPAVHAAVREPGIHPRNTNIASARSRNRREGMLCTLRCQRYLRFR